MKTSKLFLSIKSLMAMNFLFVILIFFTACAGTLNTGFPSRAGMQTDGDQLDMESDEVIEDTFDYDFLPELLSLSIDNELPVSSFREVWAYMVAGREAGFSNNHPVTDLAYFGTSVNAYGRLAGIPNFNNIAGIRARKHLVATCSGQALSYFVLMEGRPEREALIRGLLEASRPYDGLQINFEYVPAESRAAYHSFLRELRAGLGDKMFTVALAARARTLQNDVYDYATILPIVDRILVMAYDEHWSTSAPGPIASMAWCERVARYSLDTIGREKLIMGLPFYGRRWGNITPNMAFIHSGIENIMREQGITDIQRSSGIPRFTYQTAVNMTVYFEDEHSLSLRLDMYRRMGVEAVGFWRFGQETPLIWNYINLE